MSSSTPAATAVRATLRSLADQIDEHLPGTLDRSDPEHLHDLRIALRRTRSILRELGAHVPVEVLEPAKELFAHLASATGEPRDLDVQLLGWDEQLADLPPEVAAALGPVHAELEARQGIAHEDLRRVLESSETSTRLVAWRRWVEADDAPELDRSVTIGDAVSGRLGKLHKRLVRDGRAVTPESPGESLHDLRKLAKRLRYVVECFTPVFGKAERSAYLKRLKQLQDHLGIHQDAEVQVDELHGLARRLNDGSPRATELVLAIGRLSEQVDRRRAEERAAFDEWFRSYDSAATRKLVDRLLASAR